MKWSAVFFVLSFVGFFVAILLNHHNKGPETVETINDLAWYLGGHITGTSALIMLAAGAILNHLESNKPA